MIFMQPHAARQLSICLLLSLTLIGACGRQSPPPQSADAPPGEKPAAANKDEAGGPDVKLTPQQIASLGLTTTAAESVRFVPATQGFGVVLSHDAIAQTVADVATAQAQAQQSQAVLARSSRLAGTAGADSAEIRESAGRQAAVDAAALRLAEAKASAILGQHPPWAGHEDGAVLADLAAGRSKLLRVTFPLGALDGPAPKSLRVARLDAATAGERWTARLVWDAPADSGLPGRSFFALLQHTEVGEGERMLAWAMGGAEPAEPGIVVPPSAVVMSEGRYWCYVERQPGLFSRIPLVISRPMADGYFLANAIKPGVPIVTSAAGLLLARQSNPGADTD